jgi:cytochrome c oxidase subunit III
VSAPVLDLRELPDQATGPDAPEWWGIMGLVLIEGVVFIAATGSYFHLKTVNEAWPPPVTGVPDIVIPTIATLVLLLGVVPMFLAVRGIRGGSDRVARRALPVAMALVLVYLGLTVLDHAGRDWGVTTHAYGSMAMFMSGLHVAHGLAVLLMTAVVLRYLYARRIEPRRPIGLEVNAIYYYFVAATSILAWATIYLSPRILP